MLCLKLFILLIEFNECIFQLINCNATLSLHLGLHLVYYLPQHSILLEQVVYCLLQFIIFLIQGFQFLTDFVQVLLGLELGL